MEVFECGRCGHALTVPLSRVPYPVYADFGYGNGHPMPVLMEAGTYAVDEHPAATSRRIVIAPGDAHGTTLAGRREPEACCGIDGHDGPNVTCVGCGHEVATRVDACSLWQATWLEPDAVRPVPAGPARPVADWAALTEPGCAIEPWDATGRWEPRWEAELAVTLAHLAAAADGALVTFPDGPLAEILRAPLDQLYRPGQRAAGRPVRRVALAGPGLRPSGPLPDIAVVPRHPQTGEAWPTPAGVVAAPLAVGYWTYLAHHHGRPPTRVTGRLPAGVEPDDLLPPRPWHGPYPVWRAYQVALERVRGRGVGAV
ncbi:hypothetical protein ABZW03_18000 [Kitasatospora sp. NPDC004799]|uniref:hypothetical protein n=1 Tax=Kitasatospora sp. NPDC004799 TaxID=3154460 RepID=UPI0033AD2053